MIPLKTLSRSKATTSTSLATYPTKVANMVHNRKLAKSISDVAWSQFLRWVEYYGAMYGIPVVKVAPQFTSQDCSACGTRVKKTLSMRTHICPGCGVVLDRDHNAAQNILQKSSGTAGLAGTHPLASG